MAMTLDQLRYEFGDKLAKAMLETMGAITVRYVDGVPYIPNCNIDMAYFEVTGMVRGE